MIDLARSPAEKKEVAGELTPATPSADSLPDYPYGLCLCLDQDTLEKLGMADEEIGVGDIMHIHGFAKVTSVSENQDGGGSRKRVELQLTHMVAEDEDDETEGDDGDEGGDTETTKTPAAERRSKLYG